MRQDLLEQAKQESEYIEEEEDRLTEPRSEEEESAHDLDHGDYIDENMADDLGDIVNDSLSLEDNFTDAGVSSHLTQKEAKRARNIEETGEEPLSKKIKREGGRAVSRKVQRPVAKEKSKGDQVKECSGPFQCSVDECQDSWVKVPGWKRKV